MTQKIMDLFRDDDRMIEMGLLLVENLGIFLMLAEIYLCIDGGRYIDVEYDFLHELNWL